MRFRARVVDEHSHVRWLEIDADDESHARTLLRQQQRQLLSLTRDTRLVARWVGSSEFPVLMFVQELLTLLQAGLSLVEAVEALVEKESQPPLRRVMEAVQSSLRGGARLSDALREAGDAFPFLLVGLVQASEQTGGLQLALARYVQYRQRLDLLRGRLVSAAIYPAILIATGLGVAAFLLGYVVPRFATVYQGGGRSLPWASELLLGWGRFVHDNAGLAATSALLLGSAGLWWLLRLHGRGDLHRMAMLLPGAGPRLRVLEVTRLCMTLGLLLENGIGILQAMQMTASVLPPTRRDALARASARVAAGGPLSEALLAEGLATTISTRLARVGESSGQLGSMLQRAAAFHDEENARWLERFSKALEPALMAAIGAVIGGIVLLLYMPIFDLAGALP